MSEKGVVQMIYFDNSATTKPYKEVLETYLTVSDKYYGNPSSYHTLGMEAEKVLSKARQVIGSILQVDAKEIVFTSGGTEGNNLAIKGTAYKHQGRGKHIITSLGEHPSTYEICKDLEGNGFEITYLPIRNDGKVDVKDLQAALRADTILVSLIHVNNETGAIQPIEEIGQILQHYPKILFHVDHVQGITKVPLDMRAANIDLCTVSGHKFHGVKGTGFLYIRDGVTLAPLFHGGAQEGKKRPGTENTGGFAALAKALRLSTEKSIKGMEQLQQLKLQTMNGLAEIEGIVLNTGEQGYAPHIVNFSIPGSKPEVIIQALAEKNMYVSTKSACSSKLSSPSRVLLEMGVGEERASSAIRVSFSFENSKAEVADFIEAMKEIVPQLLEVMR